MSSHTKVVGTLGPASEPLVGALLDAGLSVARINFSHGEHADHRRYAEKVRAAAVEREVVVGLLADIQGPKLRLGRMEGGVRRLEVGERVRLAEGREDVAGPGELLFDFGLLRAVGPGHRVFLADGVVELRVEELWDDHALARVVRAGTVGDRKGVNLPDSDLSFDMPTEKDRRDLAFARELGVDFVGASFVSGPEDVRRVRELAPEARIVAKIERFGAVRRIAEILAEADGIMIARGDLGVEVPLEELPMLQKELTAAALAAGKFTITATEMLESMQRSPRPTRAEAADVANAVLEGTDAVMLSGESAVGDYPVEAVATMARIARAVEASQRYDELPLLAFRRSEADFSNAVARAAVEAAEDLGLETIVCFTESGNTARLLSRYRPNARILALSPNERTLGWLSVLAHVRPIAVPRETSLEEMLAAANGLLAERGLLERGTPVVFVAGVPSGKTRSTNVMKLHRIGEDVSLR